MHSAGACLDLVQRVNCPHLNEPRPCAPSFRICLSWDAWHIWHIYNDKTLLCLLNLRPVSWAGEGALVSAPVYNYKHYRTPFVKQHVSDPVPMRFRSGPDPVRLPHIYLLNRKPPILFGTASSTTWRHVSHPCPTLKTPARTSALNVQCEFKQTRNTRWSTQKSQSLLQALSRHQPEHHPCPHEKRLWGYLAIKSQVKN